MSLSLSVHPCSITALLLGTPQALLPLPQFNLQQDTLAAGTHRGKELLFQGFELLWPPDFQTPWYLSHSTTSTACRAWVLVLEQDRWP